MVRYSGPQVLAGGTVSTVGADTVHQFLSTGTSVLDLYSATINGTISGVGNLVWDKTGVLTLGGVNSYTGSTQISSGTIDLLGSIGSTSDLSFGTGVLNLGPSGGIKVLQANYSTADASADILANRIVASSTTPQVRTFNDGGTLYTEVFVVPEPASVALAGVGIGLLGLLAGRRRAARTRISSAKTPG